MSDPSGRYWVVFNGEIYNYLELRAELVGLGFSFTSETDTEVVLAAYAQWGLHCLEKFNGMWAFAIWDNVDRSLFLARDRFGIKPLYLVERGHMVSFASEQKALLTLSDVPVAPDESAIYSFLAYGTLPAPTGPRTFFAAIESVPPGIAITLTHDDRKTESYWTIDAAAQSYADDPPLEEMKALFEDAVRIRLRADVPIGTCLSGGIDSSSMVSTISTLLGQDGRVNQHTFSSVYDDNAPYNERPFIEEMVAFSGVTPHYIVPDQTKLIDDFERMIWHQDEPFPSASIFAQWCVMELASIHGITVLLDGQGADEQLAGYRPFTIYIGEVFAREGIRAAVQESQKIAAVNGNAWYQLLLVSLLRHQPFLRDRLRPGHGRAMALERRAIQVGFQEQAHISNLVDRQVAALHDMDTYSRHAICESLPHLLRYEDRNSMAFSIEARTPFLDYRLVQFIFEIAANWRVHDGWSKWILRKALEDRLPPAITWRTDKVGYGTPEIDLTYALAQIRLPRFEHGTEIAHYLNIDHVRRQLAVRPTSINQARRYWRWLVLEAWLSQIHSRYAPA